MIYYGAKELAQSFRVVRNNTLQIAEDIPESQYEFKAAPDSRSVARTLVHVAMGPTFQTYVHQNNIDDLKTVNFPELVQKISAEEAKPRSKAEIITLLKEEGEKFAKYLEGLDESFLGQRLTMPPGAEPATKSRFEMLLSPKEHEMHHRGQLMVLQRMLGMTPHLTRQMQQRHAEPAAEQGRR